MDAITAVGECSQRLRSKRSRTELYGDRRGIATSAKDGISLRPSETVMFWRASTFEVVHLLKVDDDIANIPRWRPFHGVFVDYVPHVGGKPAYKLLQFIVFINTA